MSSTHKNSKYNKESALYKRFSWSANPHSGSKENTRELNRNTSTASRSGRRKRIYRQAALTGTSSAASSADSFFDINVNHSVILSELSAEEGWTSSGYGESKETVSSIFDGIQMIYKRDSDLTKQDFSRLGDQSFTIISNVEDQDDTKNDSFHPFTKPGVEQSSTSESGNQSIEVATDSEAGFDEGSQVSIRMLTELESEFLVAMFPSTTSVSTISSFGYTTSEESHAAEKVSDSSPSGYKVNFLPSTTSEKSLAGAKCDCSTCVYKLKFLSLASSEESLASEKKADCSLDMTVECASSDLSAYSVLAKNGSACSPISCNAKRANSFPEKIESDLSSITWNRNWTSFTLPSYTAETKQQHLSFLDSEEEKSEVVPSFCCLGRSKSRKSKVHAPGGDAKTKRYSIRHHKDRKMSKQS